MHFKHKIFDQSNYSVTHMEERDEELTKYKEACVQALRKAARKMRQLNREKSQIQQTYQNEINEKSDIILVLQKKNEEAEAKLLEAVNALQRTQKSLQNLLETNPQEDLGCMAASEFQKPKRQEWDKTKHKYSSLRKERAQLLDYLFDSLISACRLLQMGAKAIDANVFETSGICGTQQMYDDTPCLSCKAKALIDGNAPTKFCNARIKHLKQDLKGILEELDDLKKHAGTDCFKEKAQLNGSYSLCNIHKHSISNPAEQYYNKDKFPFQKINEEKHNISDWELPIKRFKMLIALAEYKFQQLIQEKEKNVEFDS